MGHEVGHRTSVLTKDTTESYFALLAIYKHCEQKVIYNPGREPHQTPNGLMPF